MKYVTLLAFLLCVAQAEAAYYVCGNATKLQYAVLTDPSRIPECPPPFTVDTNGVPEADIPAQRALYDSVLHKYIKVIGGLMVEMTQAEKDAIDLPAQQQAAATAVAKNEIATNEVCANHTLPEITAYWKGPGGKQEQLQVTITTLDTAITAVAGGTAKTALQAARDALVAHMTMFISDSELQWRYLCSRTFVRP